MSPQCQSRVSDVAFMGSGPVRGKKLFTSLELEKGYRTLYCFLFVHLELSITGCTVFGCR
jgi:hypothetical protein